MKAMKRMPDENGYFGEYGGSFIPPELIEVMGDIESEYQKAQKDFEFMKTLKDLYRDFVGRPSPIYFAKNLSEKIGGAKIFLKREDLNHTGAHKINHCLGEVLLAKRMGKKVVIAETGAGQHGVALATAAALVGLKCRIFMGETDVRKEQPNVIRMKILGAELVVVRDGRKSLKEAVDKAFSEYMKDPINQFFAIGSVVGPHPYPMMVRDFQKVVGNEAKKQMLEQHGSIPDHLVACVGGGSNAIGLFTAFLNDDIQIYGVEPLGRSKKMGDHAATLTYGKPGIMHGFKSYMLQTKTGDPEEVYSIASGLDYPSVGPQHSYLKDLNRVNYVAVNDEDAINAFFELSRIEGIIPALESSHAIAYAMKLAEKSQKNEIILVNLSGRGDKDIDFISENYGYKYDI